MAISEEKVQNRNQTNAGLLSENASPMINWVRLNNKAPRIGVSKKASPAILVDAGLSEIRINHAIARDLIVLFVSRNRQNFIIVSLSLVLTLVLALYFSSTGSFKLPIFFPETAAEACSARRCWIGMNCTHRRKPSAALSPFVGRACEPACHNFVKTS